MRIEPWVYYALGSAFFAGLTAIFGKVGVSGLNSNLATFVRTAIVLLMLGAIVSFRQEWARVDQWPWKSLVFLTLSAIATGLSWLCYYRALQLGDASRVAPVDKMSVVFTILLALVFLGEKFSPQVAFGGILVTVGAVIMAIPWK